MYICISPEYVLYVRVAARLLIKQATTYVCTLGLKSTHSEYACVSQNIHLNLICYYIVTYYCLLIVLMLLFIYSHNLLEMSVTAILPY